MSGVLVRRYRRFLADVVLDDGDPIVAHCNSTGRMTGCADPGDRVWLEPAPPDSPRKLRYTWVLTERRDGIVLGVHTGYPNALVAEVMTAEGYTVRREVRPEGTTRRLDMRCTRDTDPPLWVEVKTVTLVEGETALFPDARSERARHHLAVLEDRVRAGERAAIFFALMRPDASVVAPAEAIDPDYAAALRRAEAGGVELRAAEFAPIWTDGVPVGLQHARNLTVVT